MKHKNSSTSGDRIRLGSYAEYQTGSLPVPSRQRSFTLIQTGRRFIVGVQGLMMAVRYKIFFFQTSLRSFLGRTSVRLGILGIILFLFFGQELQLAFRFLSNGDMESSRSAVRSTAERPDAMSLVQPVLSGTADQSEATFSTISVDDLDPVQVQRYIERFSQVSRIEMKRFGIPASLLMAQGIAESGAGSNEPAQKHNNHFVQQLRGQRFKTAWDSWRTHSLLLVKKYPALLAHGTDVESWARELRRAGYSHEWNYARRLVRIIDAYQLRQLDKQP